MCIARSKLPGKGITQGNGSTSLYAAILRKAIQAFSQTFAADNSGFYLVSAGQILHLLAGYACFGSFS